MLHSMITKRTYLPIFSHTTTATLLARRLRIGIRIMLRHKTTEALAQYAASCEVKKDTKIAEIISDIINAGIDNT
mgnify:CR=1 FL=1